MRPSSTTILVSKTEISLFGYYTTIREQITCVRVYVPTYGTYGHVKYIILPIYKFVPTELSMQKLDILCFLCV